MMKNLPKTTRYMIVLCLLLVILLIILFHYKVFTPSVYFQDILMGLVMGFTLWLSTQVLRNWINNNDKIKIDNAINSFESLHNKFNAYTTNTFKQHDGTTNKVLNVVQQKYLSLIEESRDKLDKKFYQDLYRNVRRARVSGISLTEFIKSFLDEDNPIIQSLKKNKNVEIKALFSDPKSEFVKHRDVIEVKKRNRLCSKNISENIKIIEKLINKYKNEHLTGNNCIEIRASKFSINSAITHVIKNETDGNEELLYMGLIFHHDLGNKMPIYRIPTGNNVPKNNLYEGCIKNFDEIFDNQSESCFLWDSDGARKKNLMAG